MTKHVFRCRALLLALGAFGVYCCHAALFGSWIVDDAGISFVYARNWAAGYGLVSQPGLAPVEGYSNFLWVALLAVFFKLGMFDPLWTPKILSLLLVAATFALVTGSAGSDKNAARRWPWAGFLAALLLSLNTPFVVWTSSGLENALLVFLLVCLYRISLLAAAGESGPRIAFGAAFVALLVALTRPDGLIYAAAFPLSLFAARLFAPPEAENSRSQPDNAATILPYALFFLLGYGAFVSFRLFYFGDILPNTFYAKSGSSGGALLGLLGRLAELPRGVGGRFGTVFWLLLCGAHGFLFWKRQLAPTATVSLLFLGLAMLAFGLLPTDWMEEMRFATPFTLFFYLWAATFWIAAEKAQTASATSSATSWRTLPWARMAVALGVVAVHVGEFGPRSRAFSHHPTVPFALVARDFGERFNRYAEVLNLPQASLLNPDLGGTLYYSKLRIYDLAGLTDKTIARSRFRSSQTSREFYDYVFQDTRPTFIHVHDWWALAARFDSDPRFRRDYVPIVEKVDATILQATGETLYAGDYVRKSACSPQKLRVLRRMATVK